MTRFRPPGAPHRPSTTPAATDDASLRECQTTLNVQFDLSIGNITIVVTVPRMAGHVPPTARG
ncbi:hypothetical protein KZZ52_41935 [Dactylosporangium sp. AC04546]|uniref:hypothetical protein n=1 Tax=Dactylosporangium sp. AC04546 TaxID=2862460 RepID=UPI001EDDCEFE|nr:hypothetical protein [Dactylosporangium sp. AC04546]WVK80487.1 hypothetical protein KZZ52_41935 [Dactylosporangium sp. AC04546]